MKQGLLSNVILFVAGAAIGSAVTYVVMRRQYEQGEYEEYYEEESEEDCEKEEEPSLKSEPKEEKTRYNKMIDKLGYNGKKEEEKEDLDMDRPYQITVDEYAEMDGYETVTLYYYADNILTDEMDNIIDDEDETVGEEALAIFRETDVDSVYVRNDARKTDYEILRDQSDYHVIHSMR